MVSTAKRMKYVSDNDYTSSEGEDFDEIYQQAQKNAKPGQKAKPKWLSRNAIMARENRLKKKMYVSNLEEEVGKLKNESEKYSKIVDNQSALISDLKTEIKYLKSVIANSSDISNLIRNIRNNTGMSVSTSLDQTLSLNNDYVSKRMQPLARKTAHPWEENRYPSFPTPESDFFSSPQSENGVDVLGDDLMTDFKLDDFLGDSNTLLDALPDNSETQSVLDDDLHLKEHNYTSVEDGGGDIEDVGVCLHVSKHRVSLEFCSKCSDNAISAWTH